MEFDKLIENPILDEIWENQRGEFEDYSLKKDKKKRQFNENSQFAEEIKEFAENYIPEEKQKEYSEKWKQYTKKEMDEFDYWTKKFFKLGIINGIKLKKEVKEESSKQNGFFDYEYSCFDEYLETKRIDNLREDNEYNKLRRKEAELKNKYPKLIRFIEDKESIDNLTIEEQKSILEMIEIKDKMFNIEKKEIYLMGMKEMINILYR